MKIRAKLNVLIFSFMCAFAASAGIYFYALLPLKIINAEHEKLLAIQTSLENGLSVCYRSFFLNFAESRKSVEQTIPQLKASFDGLEEVVYLQSKNAHIQQAVEVIKQLYPMNEKYFLATVAHYENVYKTGSKYALVIDSYDPFRLYLFYRTDELRDALAAFHKSYNGLESIVMLSSTTFAEQLALIDIEIAAVRKQAVRISLVAVCILLAAVFIAAMKVARSISGRIMNLERDMRFLQTGNLNIDFKTDGRDEITHLAQGLNEFVSVIDVSIKDIQSASEKNSISRDNLREIIAGLQKSLSNMHDSIGAVDERVQKLYRHIESARSLSEHSYTDVSEFTRKIDEQALLIESSSESVMAIIGSITDLQRFAENANGQSQNLVVVAEAGKDTVINSFDKIEAIIKKIDKIRDMVKLIDDVAVQTNILAMNAAIEASHAGDVGKGFAVVAAEIRKLAEVSASGSSQISTVVKDILSSSSAALRDSAQIRQIFDKITTDISTVTDSVNKISVSLTEINESGNAISGSLDELHTVTLTTKKDSEVVAGEIRQVTEGMDTVDSISDMVSSDMTAMLDKLNVIDSMAEKTSGVSDSLSATGVDLQERVNKFTTRQP